MKQNLINIGIKAKKASNIKIDSKSKNKVLIKFLVQKKLIFHKFCLRWKILSKEEEQ